MVPPRLEANVTSEVKVLEFRIHALEILMKDHEKRLRKTEKMLWIAIGAVSFASMVGSFIGRIVL